MFTSEEKAHIQEMGAHHDTEIVEYARSINRSPASVFSQLPGNHLLKRWRKKSAWNAFNHLAGLERAQGDTPAENRQTFLDRVRNEYLELQDGSNFNQQDLIARAEDADLQLSQHYRRSGNVSLIMQRLAKDLSESVSRGTATIFLVLTYLCFVSSLS